MKYRCTQNWKGSPDGSAVISFVENETVEESDLGKSLLDVAISEGWVEPIDRRFNNVQEYIDAGFSDEKSVSNVIKRAIGSLDVNDPKLWTSKNGPTTEAIESVLGVSVSAAERTEAWKQMQSE